MELRWDFEVISISLESARATADEGRTAGADDDAVDEVPGAAALVAGQVDAR
jgi:hypothetical protein